MTVMLDRSLLLLLLSSLLQVEAQSILCTTLHCFQEITSCYLDTQCAEVLNCLSKCDVDDAECPFICGMGSEAGKAI